MNVSSKCGSFASIVDIKFVQFSTGRMDTAFLHFLFDSRMRNRVVGLCITLHTGKRKKTVISKSFQCLNGFFVRRDDHIKREAWR